MNEDFFSRKESIKDIFLIIEDKLRNGLFEESIADFDRIMAMDFEYPNLYENISCVKFWINKLDDIKKREGSFIECCRFLDYCYKKFCIFIRNKSYDDNLISIKAIHYFVYSKTVDLIISENSEDVNDKEKLKLLANAFTELEDYSRALKAYEYLDMTEPYNSNTLAFIAEINHRLGDDRRAKMYIREALFYEPLDIRFEKITIDEVRKIRDIIIERKIHNNSPEEIISWMSAYGELTNILDVKRELSNEEEIELRKNISRLEADYRKFKLRDKTAPKLLASYAFLTTRLIMRRGKSDIKEVEVWGRKMANLDKDLVQCYIKNLEKR